MTSTITQGRLTLTSPRHPYVLAADPTPVEPTDGRVLLMAGDERHVLPAAAAALAVGRRAGGRHELRILTVSRKCVMKAENYPDVSVPPGIYYLSEKP